ncbi:hypothetical protein ACJ73_08172 [Blastomyces percursus]|uniref:Uncharacterized protein n=1 Tax=Blastomyces percursus TaxID=1658174 RepID=A0A1J9PVX3_9EURO|nr:hypothetical protein ACJ73_08172 [Blastomyces percursus]
MADNSLLVRHRQTIFPRTSPSDSSPPLKRVFPGNSADDKRKLQRMIPVNPRSGFITTKKQPTSSAISGVRKEEINPSDRYDVLMKLNQAGPAKAAYGRNSSFNEVVVREVKVHDKEWLSKVIEADHGNIVRLQEALYYDGSI